MPEVPVENVCVEAERPFIDVIATPDAFTHLNPVTDEESATNICPLFPIPTLDNVAPVPTSKSPVEYVAYPVPP